MLAPPTSIYSLYNLPEFFKYDAAEHTIYYPLQKRYIPLNAENNLLLGSGCVMSIDRFATFEIYRQAHPPTQPPIDRVWDDFKFEKVKKVNTLFCGSLNMTESKFSFILTMGLIACLISVLIPTLIFYL